MHTITIETLARLKATHEAASTLGERLESLWTGDCELYEILPALAPVALACDQLPPPLWEEGQAQRQAMHANLLAREYHAAHYQWDQFVERLARLHAEWTRDLHAPNSTPETLAAGHDLCRLLVVGEDSTAITACFEDLVEQIDSLPAARQREGRSTCVAVGEQIRLGEYHAAAYQLRLFLRRLAPATRRG